MAAEKHNNKDSQTTNTSAGRTPAGSKDISFDSKAFVGALLRKLTQLSYIKPGEVPNIDLYMDQVTTFMDEHLSDIKRYEDDKTLTKTMINNYTKNKLLPPPVKKKYSSDHLYIMAFIYYFKQMLSIGDIQKLLTPMTEDFFGDNDVISLEKIYKEVYQLEKEQVSNVSKDIFFQHRKASASFENIEDEHEREYLQKFAFISMLIFDIYMKKNIIENIIDEMDTDRNK